jgi:hypothetical protein
MKRNEHRKKKKKERNCEYELKNELLKHFFSKNCARMWNEHPFLTRGSFNEIQCSIPCRELLVHLSEYSRRFMCSSAVQQAFHMQ